MEISLGEVLKGIGFDTEVTRASEDGGFDISLRDERGNLFLIEVNTANDRSTAGLPVRSSK